MMAMNICSIFNRTIANTNFVVSEALLLLLIISIGILAIRSVLLRKPVKVAWIIVILVAPVLGSLIYFIYLFLNRNSNHSS